MYGNGLYGSNLYGQGSAFDKSVPLGNITVEGFAPIVSAGSNVEVPLGSVSVDGFAPEIFTGANIQPNLGIISVQGFEPVISTGRDIQVPAGVIGLSGLEPTISTGSNIFSPVGSIGVSGFSPIVATLTGFLPKPDVTIDRSQTDEEVTVTVSNRPVGVTTEVQRAVAPRGKFSTISNMTSDTYTDSVDEFTSYKYRVRFVFGPSISRTSDTLTTAGRLQRTV